MLVMNMNSSSKHTNQRRRKNAAAHNIEQMREILQLQCVWRCCYLLHQNGQCVLKSVSISQMQLVRTVFVTNSIVVFFLLYCSKRVNACINLLVFGLVNVTKPSILCQCIDWRPRRLLMCCLYRTSNIQADLKPGAISFDEIFYQLLALILCTFDAFYISLHANTHFSNTIFSILNVVIKCCMLIGEIAGVSMGGGINITVI